MRLNVPPLSSAMRSGWIVNSGVVYNAYQFEPDWDPEDISEEDRAEPVQARLLMVCGCCCLILLNTLLFVSATASVSFLIYSFILIKALIQHSNRTRVHL